MAKKIKIGKQLLVFFFSLLVFFILLKILTPLLDNYNQLTLSSYIDWEKELLFLFLLFLGIIITGINIGSLLAILRGGRHYCNVEISVLIGYFAGCLFISIPAVIFILSGKDLKGLNLFLMSTFFGSFIGLLVGVRNEFENRGRKC
jgi:hypothetical protein